MKGELHTEEAVPTEPEATTSEPLRHQVNTLLIFQLIHCFYIFLGGKLVLHLIKKHTKGTQMQGVKVARPHDFKRLTSARRTVSRAYGGIFTGTEVRDKITTAFLIEEFKRFKNISKTSDKKEKKNKKAKSAKKAAKK